ncbi:MAG: HAMP domain-containing histidine kinase, partial [Cyclobacteriaceae bacterium]|nr:HAMP domain-containing histidine kinase [Cyclobacteriaceae bacterium]
AILNVLNTSYREEIIRNYQRRTKNVAENLVSVTEGFIQNTINRDQFGYKLFEASNLVQADIIIYDKKGQLLGTNRNEVFNLDLLSRNIHPSAFRELRKNPGQMVVLTESIGTLAYKTVYTGILSLTDGRLIGFLALPFFDSQSHLNRQQIEVFSNLIILFAVILVFSLVAGNIQARKLISPIKLIAERLKKVNYLENTSPLTYEARDEIGMLVHEYNQMVQKLENSRVELVKIQKETAWKEIARQVAHEIKNPLTPMRLKIQQMQRGFEASSKEYQTLNSLVIQIDTLAAIADSFSAFAQMPVPHNEPLDLSVLTLSVISLYKNEDYVLSESIESGLFVVADSKLLSQILNNLLLNAVQSTDRADKYIQVDLARSGSKAVLAVRDNGRGISEEWRDKIFKPYFSTKEKGSGIGLALAKKGIEQANGHIWFETETGQGTVFYLSLPLYEPDDGAFPVA